MLFFIWLCEIKLLLVLVYIHNIIEIHTKQVVSSFCYSYLCIVLYYDHYFHVLLPAVSLSGQM